MERTEYQKCAFTADQLMKEFSHGARDDCQFCRDDFEVGVLCRVSAHGADAQGVEKRRAHWDQAPQGKFSYVEFCCIIFIFFCYL